MPTIKYLCHRQREIDSAVLLRPLIVRLIRHVNATRWLFVPSVPIWRVTLFVLSVALLANAQDGSSELTPDKTVSALGVSRLRVRCTDDNLRLYPNATACADEREPESCRMVFTTPASSSPAARDPKCDNLLLKDLADQCRRTCAICCEDASYACQNDESGIVNCNQNMEKCGMAEFSQMMIKFCPATCGLCLARKCWDQIDECESMKSLCTNEIYATFMEHQCARTCGKCKSPDDSSGEENGSSATSSEETETGPLGKDQEMKHGHKLIIHRPDSSGHRPKSSHHSGSENSNENGGEPIDGSDNGIDSGMKKDRPTGKKGRDRPTKRPGDDKSNVEEEEETCVDILKNCRRNKKFCRHKSYIEMMRQNCARTCGFCRPKSEKKHVEKGSLTSAHSGGTSKPAAGARSSPARVIDPDCKDNHPFCKGWAANGYCESDEYSDEEKQDKCAKTCGYC